MMFHPGLVFRGLLFGCVVLIALASLATANATLAAQAPEVSLSTAVQTKSETTEMAATNLDGCTISPKFPPKVRRWCSLITRVAEKHDLPPDLIAALIWQESGGNPAAYSRSGAVGLMQVMPRDGIAARFNCPNGPCFAKRPTIKQLKDPEFNLEYGARMLARLLAQRGDLREALKAYGPMDVGYTYADKVLTLYQQYGE